MLEFSGKNNHEAHILNQKATIKLHEHYIESVSEVEGYENVQWFRNID